MTHRGRACTPAPSGLIAACRSRKRPEGIDVDATYADVLRIYGQPTSRGELSLAPVPSLWIDYDDRGVAFDFITETGEMILVKVSRPGARGGSSDAT